MPIKLTVREAIAVFQSIQGLPRLPNGKVTYEIGYISDKLESAVQRFEKERDKLRRETSVEVEVKEAGKVVIDKETGEPKKEKRIPPEKQDEFMEQLEAMLDADVTVEREPIKLSVAFPDAPAKLSDEDKLKWEERYPRPTAAELRGLSKIIIE
jgi:hypothetical protein